MNKYQLVISLIEGINNFSSSYMTEHEEAREEYNRFMNAIEEAKIHGLVNEAVSYYNFKYLVDLHGNNSNFFIRTVNDYKGTKELSDQLIQMANGSNLIDSILSKPAWGRKEILSLPHGDQLSIEMKKINKTSLGTKDIIHLLFGIEAKKIGFIYFNEFIEMMKLEKTMVNRTVAQNLLKRFWESTRDYYKHNPFLFNTIKSVIINLNSKLKDSNSTQQLRLEFMKEFISLTYITP